MIEEEALISPKGDNLADVSSSFNESDAILVDDVAGAVLEFSENFGDTSDDEDDKLKQVDRHALSTEPLEKVNTKANAENVSLIKCVLDVCDRIDAQLKELDKPASDVDRQQNSKSMKCNVCKEKTLSGKHFGIYTCDNCRNFFARSVGKALRKRANTCTNVNTTENQQISTQPKQLKEENSSCKGVSCSCSGCRLNKCLQKGMQWNWNEPRQENRQMATENLSEIMREIESLRKVIRQLNAPITPSSTNLDKLAETEQAAGTVRKFKMPSNALNNNKRRRLLKATAEE